MQVIASTEAAIMTRLKNIAGICPVYDFGVDSEAAYLVMPKYQGSMREWRLQQAGFAECSAERTYLQLFWQATCYVQVGSVSKCSYSVICSMSAVCLDTTTLLHDIAVGSGFGPTNCSSNLPCTGHLYVSLGCI